MLISERTDYRRRKSPALHATYPLNWVAVGNGISAPLAQSIVLTLAQLLMGWLQATEHTVRHFDRGQKLIEALATSNPDFDLVVLDWELPDATGIEVLHHIRNQIQWHVPILFVTQREAETDIINALSSGADDYMIKQINRGEFLARINALGRRLANQELDFEIGMKVYARALRCIFVTLVLLAAPASWGDDWLYTVRPGDKLWDIAENYCGSGRLAQVIADHNGLANSAQLQAGQRIAIPTTLLAFSPSNATIVQVTGDIVILQNNGSQSPAQAGDAVNMGDYVISSKGAALVSFADGSQISIAPDSKVLFNKLTAFGPAGMVDTHLRFTYGQGEATVKPQNRGDRFRIQTPEGIAAVRGTQFRVGRINRDEGPMVSTTETLEGLVAYSGQGQSTDVPAGFGVAASSSGVVKEALLVAPVFNKLPEQVTAGTTLSWQALAGAEDYVVEWARQAQPGIVYASTTTSATQIQPPQIPGAYLLSVRGVSSSRIQGNNARQAINVLNPAPTDLNESVRVDGHYFQWFSGFDRLLYDAGIQRMTIEPDKDIIIVGIDDKSLHTFGPWPWPRPVQAELLRAINIYQPAKVAVDIIYAGTSPDDKPLVEAASQIDQLSLPVMIESLGARQQHIEVLPFADLLSQADQLGHVHVELDEDAIVRGTYLYQGVSAVDLMQPTNRPFMLPRLKPKKVLLATVTFALLPIVVSAVLLSQGLYLTCAATTVAVLLLYPLWSWRRHEIAWQFISNELTRMDDEEQKWRKRSGNADAILSQNAVISTLDQLLGVTITPILQDNGTTQLQTDHKKSLTEAESELLRSANQQYFNSPTEQAVLPGEILAAQISRLETRARAVREGQSWVDIMRDVVLLKSPVYFEGRSADARPVYVSAEPLPDTQTQLFAGFWVITFSDLSAIRAAQAQREEALAFLSHDIRSPLLSVLALIRGQQPASPLLEDIEKYTQKGLSTSEQFLQLSRLQLQSDFERYELQLEQVLYNAIEQSFTLSREKAITISTGAGFDSELEDNGIWLYANGELLERAFVNLLTNAIKYSPPDTTISIDLKIKDSKVHVIFKDQGYGIPAEELPHIFEPFFRSSEKRLAENRGAGLGLRFVKTVIERHTGSISVTSTWGEGTTFELVLPYWANAALEE
ncbi:phoR [Symbiodinium pilosum]|uniref:histidine kinase n=1 Tax=Symbiodinium pilosum TaxID=2952 RepID=A0A812RX15_SYMPI|nr:phoR [Symbiodinium pilosum]